MSRVEGLTIDETFELLSHSRARLVLQYFDQHANPVKLEDVATTVARWEAPSGTNPSDASVETVSEALHDDAFPWLSDLGLCSYDAEGRMLRYDGRAISRALANAETVLAFVWSDRERPDDIEAIVDDRSESSEP